MEKEKNAVERCLIIYRRLLDGGSYNSRDLQDLIFHKTGKSVTLRSIQRDLVKLRELPELGIEENPRGNETLYSINFDHKRLPHAFNINSNDLLSFYILKAYLKTFKGTTIENLTKDLFSKISKFAPEDVFFEEELFWDKNIGNFDYSSYNILIDKIINIIRDKIWVKVKYDTAGRGVSNTFRAYFRKIFTYAGYMYIIAYIPAHKHDIALAIHRIEQIDELKNDDPVPPFNKTRFSKNRFGVFEAAPQKVVLKINPALEKYFINRFWHQSQNLIHENGDILLTMKVPITNDFLSWLMSWTGSIEVLEPKSLRDRIIIKMEKALKKYEETGDKKALI